MHIFLFHEYRLEVDNSELAPYFSLGNCVEGLNMLFNSLYGVKLEHQQPLYGELWNPDVQKLVIHFV